MARNATCCFSNSPVMRESSVTNLLAPSMEKYAPTVPCSDRISVDWRLASSFPDFISLVRVLIFFVCVAVASAAVFVAAATSFVASADFFSTEAASARMSSSFDTSTLKALARLRSDFTFALNSASSKMILKLRLSMFPM